MIQTMLLRLRDPGLYLSALALKELRLLVSALCAGKTAEAAGADFRKKLKKARSARQGPHGTARLRAIEQIAVLAGRDLAEARENEQFSARETAWFTSSFLALLDELLAALTGVHWGSGPAQRRSAALIRGARKQLELLKTGRLHSKEDFIGTLKASALSSSYGAWLDEAERLLEHIPAAGTHWRNIS